MMILKHFRVTNFRSVMDSGWIDSDNVTSLVGVNEAGKSNIILALWKLNPAREGEIDLLHDMPTKEYSAWRSIPNQKEFISAIFELNDTLVNRVTSMCGCNKEAAKRVQISRRYNGNYYVIFPDYRKNDSVPAKTVQDRIVLFTEEFKPLVEKTQKESGVKDKIHDVLLKISDMVSSKTGLTQSDCNTIIGILPNDINWAAVSEISSKYEAFKKSLQGYFETLKDVNPANTEEIRKLMVAEMPSFVYYSNYGNLDAQIYLPHVVKLLDGEEILGFDNEAKVRTLRVLFDFVHLEPQEVLELGKDPAKIIRDSKGTEQEYIPTEEEIATATKKKEERATLLQSASSKLTREFADWWKQGSYRFRLQADGDFFKIWVSDDKRPEEIELERRSTGLQWFLSFFLIFLVESKDAHKGAILLLDEAGLTLHPMAQKDLVAFFDNLAKTNQIIHTTHSPFLVDTSNIDRVKVVYLDEDGYTVASSNLRAADDKLNEKSIYAVHAALGLSVSDIILQGCQPIIVEGPSDQFYLNAIKLYLIKNQKFLPNLELVFLPSGGVRGVSGVVSIVCGKDGKLPKIILDSDSIGKDAKQKLFSRLYSANAEDLLEIDDYSGLQGSEIEDLIPHNLLNRHLDRLFHDVENENFEDSCDKTKPIVPQIEEFAKRNNIELERGWKVFLAKYVKQQLQRKEATVPDEYVEKWEKLFNQFNIIR
jgi:predicted ATPase